MKYVVLIENQFCLLGYEYFGKSADKVKGFHDPNRADHFNSVKEAKEFASLFEVGLPIKIEALEKHAVKFKSCKYEYRSFPFLNPSLDKPYSGENAKAVFNWRWNYLTSEERKVKSENYRTWPELHSLFNHIWNPEKWNSKDYKEFYYTFTVYTNKDGEFKNFNKEFSLIKEKCTLLDTRGYKQFPIFDKDLSEFGTRFLCYKSDDDCFIQSSRYGTPEKRNLKQCFDEMRSFYYYNETTPKALKTKKKK